MAQRRRTVAIAVAVATAVLVMPTAAWARFTSSPAASLSVTADVLGPATNVTSTKHCTFLGIGGNTVTVDWTASPDTYAAGYTATLSTSSGTAATASVTGRTTTEATLTVPKINTAYTVTVVTNYQQWTSAGASPSSTVSCNLLGG